jgi:hypothetical protein
MQKAVANVSPPTDAAEQCVQAALTECAWLTERLAGFSRILDMSIAALPPGKQALYQEKAAQFRVFRRPLQSALNDNVISIFKDQEELTASQVRDKLISKGFSVEQKQVFNAIDYLIRKGRLERKGPGRYYCPEYGIGIEGYFDEEIDGLA